MKRALLLSLLCTVISVTLTGCSKETPTGPPKSAETSPPSVLPAAAYEEIEIVNSGSIAGVVKFSGSRPKLEPRPVTKSPEICGHAAKPPEDLILGEGGAVRNAVVMIEAIKRGKKVSTAESPVLDQKKCDYLPHVQSVTAGSTLEIRNSDDLLHNVHGKLDGKATVFNIAMPLKNQKITKQLTKPGLITLQCDAGHTWMNGYVVVVEHPYHATTDKKGMFVLAGVPPGVYKVKTWHERLGTLVQEVTVSAASETKISFEFKTQ